MRLNHLDLHVPDVAATRDFFIRHFALRHVETRGTDGLAILTDDAGFALVISHPPKKFGGTDQVTIGGITYHMGFLLPDKDEVDILYARLKSGGAELLSEPREMRGAWVFYCKAPGNILVEVGWRGMRI